MSAPIKYFAVFGQGAVFDLDSRLFHLSSEEINVADGSVVPFLCEAIFVCY